MQQNMMIAACIALKRFKYSLSITSSHLSAHVINWLLQNKNRKFIPKSLMVKYFSKCNPPDSEFNVGKLNNKKSLMVPYGVMFFRCNIFYH